MAREIVTDFMPGADKLLKSAASERIPMKPAMHSNVKPATRSDLKPATVPI